MKRLIALFVLVILVYTLYMHATGSTPEVIIRAIGRQQAQQYGLVGEPVKEELIMTTHGAYQAWMEGMHDVRHDDNQMVFVYYIQGDFSQSTSPYASPDTESLILVMDAKNLKPEILIAYPARYRQPNFDTLPSYRAALILPTMQRFTPRTRIIPETTATP
jgi:hypothetical protein